MSLEKNKRDAVIVAYGRTPLAKAKKGYFAGAHPVDYAAQTLKGVLSQLENLDTALIDDVVVGCAMPEHYNGYNIARLIAQEAGLPDNVGGQTVNRFCASGLQAIETAANAIKADEMDVVIAGGTEFMTDVKMYQPKEYQYKELAERIPGTYMSMGMTAENVAERFGVSREAMEQMAVESHQKADAARKAGKFKEEIIPIAVKTEEGIVKVTEDEGIRPGTTAEKLAAMQPCFKENGVVTAATSSQMTDGAGFVVMMARETAEKLGYQPIARFVGYTAVGVPSDIMGVGPTAAVPKVMKRAGLTIEQMDVIEINEAFAAQAIYCIRKLNLPEERVNPNGGAMALGHPLGATGTVLTCKAISELKRTGGRYGLVTMCVGGGMGAAGIIEMEN